MDMSIQELIIIGAMLICFIAIGLFVYGIFKLSLGSAGSYVGTVSSTSTFSGIRQTATIYDWEDVLKAAEKSVIAFQKGTGGMIDREKFLKLLEEG